MSDPQWAFRKMSRGEINVDPIEGEFFSTEALGSLSDAIVREAIQNSLDAGIPGEKVRVAVTFSSSEQRLLPPRSDPYVKGLGAHLDAEGSGLVEQVFLTEPMDYILIEDFGTRGLAGDVREDEDSGTGETKNDFFYFWRNIGRAVEGTTARGRWGLGKTVFQAASRINSFFGLTIRRDDPRKLLMGQAVLKIHRAGGGKYAPYGYYGLFDDDFALPVEDETRLSAFFRDFSLRRGGESGLSVIVPFPDPDITPEAVIRAVIHQYFFPILSGDLVVTVGSGRSSQTLDAGSLFTFVATTDWSDKDNVIRRLELAKWSLSLSNEKYEHLKEPGGEQAPKWDESVFESAQMERLRRKFDEGERIALLAPLWVKRQKGALQHSFFRIILERDNRLDRGEDHFIREGVTITGISSLRQKGIRLIVSVSDKPLSRLLGDSENPAHTEWQERSPKFRGRYDRGVSCLRYVKSSPREIVKILSRPAEGRDTGLLRNIFYVDLSGDGESPRRQERPTGKPGVGEAEAPVPETTGSRILQLQRIKDGFRLFADPESRRLPRTINLEVAYDVREGNPFKRYHTFDFELDKPPMEISAKGLLVQHTKPNALRLTLERPDFDLVIRGFDLKRDIKIKTATPMETLYDPTV